MIDEISSIRIDENTYSLKDAVARGQRTTFKIFGADPVKGDLSVVKLSADEYARMLDGGIFLSNAIYVVEAPNVDAFKRRVTNVAPPADLSDAANKSYVDQAMAGVGIRYVSEDRKIVLSAGPNVTSVDCGDFIKDGMLSTVELREGQLVFNFNVDAGSQPISVALSNFIDETQYWKKSETSSAAEISGELKKYQLSGNYLTSHQPLSDYYAKSETSSARELSTAFENAGGKVYFDNRVSGVAGSGDLSVVRLSADEYVELVKSGGTLSNCLYILDGDAEDVYGRRVVHVAWPKELSDAATKGYVDDAVGQIDVPGLSNYYMKSETSSASEIEDALEDLGGKAVIVRQGVSSEVSPLVINDVTREEYLALSAAGMTSQDQLYMIDPFSSRLDAGGDWVTGVKSPQLSDDAATKGYVDQAVAGVEVPTDLSSFTNSPGYATTGYVDGLVGDLEQILDSL